MYSILILVVVTNSNILKFLSEKRSSPSATTPIGGDEFGIKEFSSIGGFEWGFDRWEESILGFDGGIRSLRRSDRAIGELIEDWGKLIGDMGVLIRENQRRGEVSRVFWGYFHQGWNFRNRFLVLLIWYKNTSNGPGLIFFFLVVNPCTRKTIKLSYAGYAGV